MLLLFQQWRILYVAAATAVVYQVTLTVALHTNALGVTGTCTQSVDTLSPRKSKPGFCYAQICFDCGDKKKKVDDKLLLKEPPKEPPPPPKRRKMRPDVTYEEVVGASATDWCFPTDWPRYLTTFIKFMNFILSKHWTKSCSDKHKKQRIIMIF